MVLYQKEWCSLQIFGQLPTEHPAIERMEKDFENHILLWHTANDFFRALPQWMDGPFTLIDAEELQSNMDKWYRASAKCAKLLVREPKIVAEELKRQVAAFMVPPGPALNPSFGNSWLLVQLT